MATVKTAVSLPERTLRELDELAQRSGTTRSKLVADACDLYLRRKREAEVTRSYNEIYRAMPPAELQEELAWVRATSQRTFQRLEQEDGGWGRDGEHPAG